MNTSSEMLQKARDLRENMTRQERKLWYEFLRSYPMKFYKQRPIGPYIADFYCHERKMVVELDGSQHYEAEGQARDLQRDRYFASRGIRVLRISNLEVDRNFSGVCQAVMTALDQASPFGGGGTAQL